MYCFVKLIKERIEIKCGASGGLGTTGKNLKSAISSAIRIYPNPTTDLLTLELPTIVENSTRLRILNLAGKKLYDRVAQNGSKLQVLHVDFLPSGLYFIQIVMPDKKMIIEKFGKHSIGITNGLKV